MVQAITSDKSIRSSQSIDNVATLYDRDFLEWVQVTVDKLRAQDFSNLDLENLIEEVDSLGRSQKSELRNRLTILLEHLLKRIYVDLPQEFNGWERTIREQRRRIFFELEDSPSLKTIWEKYFDDAWKFAIKDVRAEYAAKGFTLPDRWQFSRDIDAILDIDFWEEM
jgi:hypothetical protein